MGRGVKGGGGGGLQEEGGCQADLGLLAALPTPAALAASLRVGGGVEFISLALSPPV